MRTHPKSAQFYVVKNAGAANEALYQRAVKIAQGFDIITVRQIREVLRCCSTQIRPMIERMEREGIVGPKENYNRRRVLVRA